MSDKTAVWKALAKKLGRAPTQDEIEDEVLRIICLIRDEKEGN